MKVETIRESIRKSFRFFWIPGVAMALVASAGYWFYFQTHRPYRGYASAETYVRIPKGYSVPQIARLLASAGVVRSAPLFSWYVRLCYRCPALKAGEYQFAVPLGVAAVVDKLRRGEVYYHRVTIPEGLTAEATIAEFVRHGIGRTHGFRQAVRNPHLVSDLDPLARDLEGYLFPDTYFVRRDTSEVEVVEMMVRGFLRIWTQDRQQRAQELAMTPREIVTLASLIEKETGLPAERPLVSAVFHTRLRRNIRLCSDPTVVFAVRRTKEYDGVINQSDLKLDSPYNTYLYAGLPPGPIANPGLAALEAALHPAAADFLYFVSKNDGSHVFSRDYAGHRRAVLRYQR